ncbi:AAA family ATPase [Natronorarus salvus]|uniref:AAA family ATPase n=1 Tax=Natronorarus salvus TaxID=3117733 RepID=UPI002F2663A9
MSNPDDVYTALQNEIEGVLIGKADLIENLTISLLTGGHVLLEGVPGVAKTTAANLFARASGLNESRIQMTPDLLPADITGTHVYRQSTGEFVLQRGPIFTNLLIADEINRATPKTQSALLEAMQERQVTIEGDTLTLPSPFMVVATQNPIEMEGTFELPEAQRDRFQLKLTVDIPTHDEERALLDRFGPQPNLGANSIEQVVSPSDFLDSREVVIAVHVVSEVHDYILSLVEASRDHPDVEYGGSPRASLALLHTSKARAAIRGRDYVIPDDVKSMVPEVLAHRLVLTAEAELSGVTSGDVIEDLLSTVEIPVTDGPNGAVATSDGRKHRE